MTVWRLVKLRYAASAFDGSGARLNGGRWSSVGTRVAYASDSIALATLEVLLNLGSPEALTSYSVVTARIPDACVERMDLKKLPASWKTFPAPLALQAVGDAWAQSGRSLALLVPSAVAAGSWNVLVNPVHRDFRRIRIAQTRH